jgi:hypothetical protein
LARALKELTTGSSVNVISAFGGDDALASGALGVVVHGGAVVRDIGDTWDDGEVLGYGRGDSLNADGGGNHSLHAINDASGVLDDAICDVFAVGGRGMVLGVGVESGRNGLGAKVGGIGGGSRGMGGRFGSKGGHGGEPFDIGRVHGNHTRQSCVVTTSSRYHDGDGSTVLAESPTGPHFLDPPKSARCGPAWRGTRLAP